MRLGIFGGTFDPVHFGHLAAAEEAAYRLTLDRVLFVPAQHQPLKEHAPRATNGDRLALLRLATEDNARFDVSKVELERPAPSYTVDTLHALERVYASGCRFYVLLGIDAANTLDRWRRPAELLQLATLVVMSRGGIREPDWAMLRRIDPRAERRVELLAVPNLDVTSRELRRRVAAGEPIRYQAPDAVCAYIEEHGLYR